MGDGRRPVPGLHRADPGSSDSGGRRSSRPARGLSSTAARRSSRRSSSTSRTTASGCRCRAAPGCGALRASTSARPGGGTPPMSSRLGHSAHASRRSRPCEAPCGRYRTVKQRPAADHDGAAASGHSPGHRDRAAARPSRQAAPPAPRRRPRSSRRGSIHGRAGRRPRSYGAVGSHPRIVRCCAATHGGGTTSTCTGTAGSSSSRSTASSTPGPSPWCRSALRQNALSMSGDTRPSTAAARASALAPEEFLDQIEAALVARGWSRVA